MAKFLPYPKLPPIPKGYAYNPTRLDQGAESYVGHTTRWVFINYGYDKGVTGRAGKCVAQLQLDRATNRWKAAVYNNINARTNQNSYTEDEFSKLAAPLEGDLTAESVIALITAHKLTI